MCHKSSGVLGRRDTNPEPSLADISFLRSFILPQVYCYRSRAKGSKIQMRNRILLRTLKQIPPAATNAGSEI